MTVHAALPEVHLWHTQIPLEAPHEPHTYQLRVPTLQAAQTMWHLLEDGARFVRNPLAFVGGSGQTPELALQRAQLCFQEAIGRGALQRLRECQELVSQARTKAERRGDELGLDKESFERWQLESTLLDELAEAHFGPVRRDERFDGPLTD